MSKEFSKEETIQHKKIAIRKINNLIEHSIYAEDYKKANLLSYWMEEFSEYVAKEKTFDPTRIIRYSRGDVIKLNFGFRIGNEYGGLHYAVVIENNNSHSSGTVVVIPLTSYKEGKKINERNVDLGSELFEKISAKHEIMLNEAKANLEHLSEVNSALSIAKPSVDSEEFQLVANSISEQLLNVKAVIEQIQRNGNEIAKMKFGGIALTNQITAISKQRIYVPKKSTDLLYGISLSDSAMDKINVKITELFLHK